MQKKHIILTCIALTLIARVHAMRKPVQMLNQFAQTALKDAPMCPRENLQLCPQSCPYTFECPESLLVQLPETKFHSFRKPENIERLTKCTINLVQEETDFFYKELKKIDLAYIINAYAQLDISPEMRVFLKECIDKKLHDPNFEPDFQIEGARIVALARAEQAVPLKEALKDHWDKTDTYYLIKAIQIAPSKEIIDVFAKFIEKRAKQDRFEIKEAGVSIELLAYCALGVFTIATLKHFIDQSIDKAVTKSFKKNSKRNGDEPSKDRFFV